MAYDQTWRMEKGGIGEPNGGAVGKMKKKADPPFFHFLHSVSLSLPPFPSLQRTSEDSV